MIGSRVQDFMDRGFVKADYTTNLVYLSIV